MVERTQDVNAGTANMKLKAGSTELCGEGKYFITHSPSKKLLLDFKNLKSRIPNDKAQVLEATFLWPIVYDIWKMLGPISSNNTFAWTKYVAGYEDSDHDYLLTSFNSLTNSQFIGCINVLQNILQDIRSELKKDHEVSRSTGNMLQDRRPDRDSYDEMLQSILGPVKQHESSSKNILAAANALTQTVKSILVEGGDILQQRQEIQATFYQHQYLIARNVETEVTCRHMRTDVGTFGFTMTFAFEVSETSQYDICHDVISLLSAVPFADMVRPYLTTTHVRWCKSTTVWTSTLNSPGLDKNFNQDMFTHDYYHKDSQKVQEKREECNQSALQLWRSVAQHRYGVDLSTYNECMAFDDFREQKNEKDVYMEVIKDDRHAVAVVDASVKALTNIEALAVVMKSYAAEDPVQNHEARQKVINCAAKIAIQIEQVKNMCEASRQKSQTSKDKQKLQATKRQSISVGSSQSSGSKRKMKAITKEVQEDSKRTCNEDVNTKVVKDDIKLALQHKLGIQRQHSADKASFSEKRRKTEV